MKRVLVITTNLNQASFRLRVAALVGPTAAGKTETALALAEAVNAEIISADSHINEPPDLWTTRVPTG